MKSAGGWAMPGPIERLRIRTETCACGGTIRCQMAWPTIEQMEQAVEAAVRLHQLTERHIAYSEGRKYLG